MCGASFPSVTFRIFTCRQGEPNKTKQFEPKFLCCFSRNERKDRKEHCNVGGLQIIKARPPFPVFTNWVNCHKEWLNIKVKKLKG